MDFNSTPVNVSEMLVMALGIIALYWLFRQKTDSNMPLLFYIAMIIFMTMTDRDFHPYLFYPGLGLALLLRFEFGHRGFAAETDLAGAFVDADAFDGDGVANLDNVLGAAHVVTHREIAR